MSTVIVEAPVEEETAVNGAGKDQFDAQTPTSLVPKLFMDAYGKHYTGIEDLVRARSKQVASLYENIEGLTVFPLFLQSFPS